MKKIISLSLVLVIALACIPFSASAVSLEWVAYNKMTAARDKLYAEKQSFSTLESYELYLYLSADGDPDKFKDSYVENLKTDIKNNSTGDAASCALAILNLEKMGIDASKFDIGEKTVNIYSMLRDKSAVLGSSPYLYRFVFEAGVGEELKNACLDELNKTYVAGLGNDPWGYGYSCDTNASLGAVYVASGVEKEKAADMAETLSAYKAETGYFYDNLWSTTPNADSTGCALSLFSCIGDLQKAKEAFKFLEGFEVQDKAGAYFSAYSEGAFDAYATRDALSGLIDFYKLVRDTDAHEHNYAQRVVESSCTKKGYTVNVCSCGDTYVDAYTDILEHNFKADVVAPTLVNAGYTQQKCTLCGEIKKDEAGYTLISKLTAPTGKVKGLKCLARSAVAQKITWNKFEGAKGYLVQISNAKGAWSTYAHVTSNVYIFTKLASGVNYKFRVRVYDEVGGKKIYGPWSETFVSHTLPKNTSVKKITPAKKAFTAQLSKVSCTGYQLQYATSAKFAGAKLKAVKGANNNKLTVKGIKGGAKYYVRVRTFKTIGGKHYYSVWSAAKAVITKK